MELLVPFALLALLAFPFAVDQLRHELRRQQVCAAAREFGVVIARSFLTEPCSRCRQRDMGLLSVGPNAHSIQYECRNCEKKFHAAAAASEAVDAAPQYRLFQTLLSAFNARYRRRRLAIAIVVRTPETPASRNATG
jgi:hypothetical protein